MKRINEGQREEGGGKKNLIDIHAVFCMHAASGVRETGFLDVNAERRTGPIHGGPSDAL